jgi:hypothetical protein
MAACWRCCWAGGCGRGARQPDSRAGAQGVVWSLRASEGAGAGSGHGAAGRQIDAVARQLVGAGIHQVDAAGQAVEPHRSPQSPGRPDGRAMLGHHHVHVQLAGHGGPQAQDLVGDHVAAVKAFHAGRCGPGR